MMAVAAKRHRSGELGSGANSFGLFLRDIVDQRSGQPLQEALPLRSS